MNETRGDETMFTSEINRRLREMGIGGTTTINDRVVTRWAENKFEVDTWGKRTVTMDQARDIIED
jgi:hypothetical protein